ncbi:hypothetical protein N9C85_01035 [Synechococcus sp. AH-224-I15]|nr:hypothetical protein [Synechococcus sp. AH-224-I15]
MHPDHLLLATALSHDMCVATTAKNGEWMAGLVVLGFSAWAAIHQDVLLMAIDLELEELELNRTQDLCPRSTYFDAR